MARSSKPRKPYRPKPAGRPILQRMRDELVLPAYSALEVLRVSTNPEALDSAWNTLAAFCNTAAVAADGAGMPLDAATAGLDALRAITARQQRTGTYRATGPELQALREAVAWFDGAAGAMHTHHITRAVEQIHRALFAEAHAS